MPINQRGSWGVKVVQRLGLGTGGELCVRMSGILRYLLVGEGLTRQTNVCLVPQSGIGCGVETVRFRYHGVGHQLFMQRHVRFVVGVIKAK